MENTDKRHTQVPKGRNTQPQRSKHSTPNPKTRNTDKPTRRCRFERTDIAGDEVVLVRILQVLPDLIEKEFQFKTLLR